jgi:hypothetical protein
VFRTLRPWSLVVFAAFASCHRGAKPENGPAEPPPPPLLLFAPQRVVLVPTARVTSSAGDSLIVQAGSAAAAGRSFDDELLRLLRERGVARDWIVPADLVVAHERNRTYAQDPYRLAVDAIRQPAFEAGGKYGEPLSSQLRTMIALHSDARFVLVPIDLRLHSAGRTRLRLALLDPRKAESLWVGQIVSDSGSAQSKAGLTQVARRVVDLFAAP